jgi:hypothetical protein
MKCVVFFALYFSTAFSMQDPSLFIKTEMKEYYKNCLDKIKIWRRAKGNKKNAFFI